MYSEEYKNWIACENETPPIVETIDSFKEHWTDAIALVNQTAAPALQHGYSMFAMDDNASIALYSESLANFSAAYAATQESMKSQATTMAAMQGQLTNIQQFCMAVSQQPPPNIYAPAQQQHTFNNRHNRCYGGGHGNNGTGGSNGGGVSFPQQQSGMVVTMPARNNPHILPLPTSIGKIGTTAIRMVVTWRTPTRAHCVV